MCGNFCEQSEEKEERQWLCAVVCEAASVVQLIVNCQGVCEKKYLCDCVRGIDNWV